MLRLVCGDKVRHILPLMKFSCCGTDYLGFLFRNGFPSNSAMSSFSAAPLVILRVSFWKWLCPCHFSLAFKRFRLIFQDLPVRMCSLRRLIASIYSLWPSFKHAISGYFRMRLAFVFQLWLKLNPPKFKPGRWNVVIPNALLGSFA